jgi:hypothetical protein
MGSTGTSCTIGLARIVAGLSPPSVARAETHTTGEDGQAEERQGMQSTLGDVRQHGWEVCRTFLKVDALHWRGHGSG